MSKREAVKLLQTQGVYVNTEYLSDTAWFGLCDAIQKAVRAELHPDVDVDEYGDWNININLTVGKKHLGERDE